MIKLTTILNSVLQERSQDVLPLKKNKWILFNPRKYKEELKDELFDLIYNAYESIGGHAKIKTSDDVFSDPDWTYWSGNDIDEDPELDVIIFGQKTPFGIKLSGVGHDGEKESKKSFLARQSAELNLKGHFAEVSEKLAEILLKQNVPVVNDQETVEKILGKSVQWLGKHPKDPSMPGNGWYSRKIGGVEHEKILVGKPKV